MRYHQTLECMIHWSFGWLCKAPGQSTRSWSGSNNMPSGQKNTRLESYEHNFIIIISPVLEVDLKKSKNFFRRSYPEASKSVSVVREMHALDLMSYHHDNKIACLNTSQSIGCMPMLASHEDPLPCLTCGSKLEITWSSLYVEIYWGLLANFWCSLGRRRRSAPGSS